MNNKKSLVDLRDIYDKCMSIYQEIRSTPFIGINLASILNDFIQVALLTILAILPIDVNYYTIGAECLKL